jgi:hypothetical protein
MNWTRGLVMLAVLSTAAVSGLAQGTESPVKDDLFAGTEIFSKGASDVTEITMDPDSLGMVSGKDGKKAHSMILNVVRTYEYDKPGMYRIEDVDAFRNKLNTGDWHCSVHTRSLKSGESTDVCNKRRTDDLSETAIITVEPKQLTFIHTIRKKSGDGQSELGEYMFLGGIHGLPSMAMLEPRLMGLEMSLQNMRLPDMGEIQAQVNAAMKNMPAMDSAEMQKKLADAQKRMSEAEQRMRDAEKRNGVTKDPELEN